ncbi:2809_t:CDS:1, partial [Racocetra fulgida]
SKQLRTLGYNYQHSNSFKKDEKKSFEYYIKAAKLGNLNVINE